MNQFVISLISIVLAVVFFAFGWLSHSAYTPGKKISKPSLLRKIQRNKTLNVVLLNAPSTYYVGNDGVEGFEYDLLKNYADYLDVDLNITAVQTRKEALALSKNKNIHIISAAIIKTRERKNRFNFGPSYFEVQEQVICSRKMPRGKKFPRNIEDLAGLHLIVEEDTSSSETLQSLMDDGYDIDVTFTDEYSTEELLAQVNTQQIDCTLVNSNEYALNLRYFSEIALAFSISGREQLAWIFPQKSDYLKQDMYAWFNVYNQSGKMAQLKDRYYNYLLFFDAYNTKMFYKRMQTRLKQYKKYFKKYGKKYNIPWTLLASISYQESHWNIHAKSFTGVKGLMMLTKSTAKILGVKNRLDPQESIHGGTRHIKHMLKIVPRGVKKEDRLRFALAAYNVGMGHIQDAQKLAERLNYNPNRWSDLKKVLPLLSQKRYYEHLKYGYARGSEPVKYVEAIYNYRDILENNLKKETN